MSVYSRIAFVSLFLALVLFAPATTAKSQHTAGQAEATRLYRSGDYDDAYRQYLKLAKKGDTLSQYRISYMLYRGLGTDVNLVKSYAWAALAAESELEPLVNYRQTLAELIPRDQRKKTRRKADWYIRRWGKKEEVVRDDRSDRVHCTGSRVGRCEAVYVSARPNAWAKDWMAAERKRRRSPDDLDAETRAEDGHEKRSTQSLELERRISKLNDRISRIAAGPGLDAAIAETDTNDS